MPGPKNIISTLGRRVTRKSYKLLIYNGILYAKLVDVKWLVPDREQFQNVVIEADLGANLVLATNEIANFRYDSQLMDLRVGGQ